MFSSFLYIKRIVFVSLAIVIILATAVHLFDPEFAGLIHRPGNSDYSKGKNLYTEYGCAGCHGNDGAAPILPAYPKIAGQNEDYLVAQIIHIRDGVRNNGGSSYMKEAMGNPSDEEIREISAYLASSK